VSNGLGKLGPDNQYPLKRVCECDRPVVLRAPDGQVSCAKCGRDVRGS
jgi:hypothetical protein